MSSKAVPVDKTNKKWINASVAASSVLLGYICFRFLNFLSEQFEVEANFSQIGPVIQGVSFLIGLGAFIYVLKNAKTSKFLEESFTELSKVVYPDKNETVGLTIRVIILVTIIGIFLGIVDVLSTMLLDTIFGMFN